MSMYTSCGWFFNDVSGIEAQQCLAYAARVLDLATDLFGDRFRAPLLDDGACGEDAAIDIFLWRDAPEAYVNTWTENRATAWDDGAPFSSQPFAKVRSIS